MSRADTQSFIDYLDNHFSIEKVSGGSQLKLESGTCPFCGESRDDLRLYMNSKTGLGQCFHCGQGFNAIRFVMANEECNLTKAIKILLGDEDTWALPEDVEDDAEIGLVFPKMISPLDSEQAMNYLNGRNIGPKLIEHFKLQYAVDNVMINGKLYYTKGRIVMPIYDIAGKIVSWQARDTTGKAHQRYLFPIGFKGAEYVYNSQAIHTNPDYLILCEGVFDAFGWYRAGFNNVIATFGKKLSDGQKAILRYINPKRLYIAWDSDADWLKYELVEKIGYIFPDIKIVDLNGKDADELGTKELAMALSNSNGYSWEDKILHALK